MAVSALCFQLTLDNHLGGDTGMVGTHLPQSVVAGHAVIADQGVHNGFLEAMSHMQATRHIGRWNHDAVGLFATLGSKIAIALPLFVPAGFDVGGLECLFHGCRLAGSGPILRLKGRDYTPQRSCFSNW